MDSPGKRKIEAIKQPSFTIKDEVLERGQRYRKHASEGGETWTVLPSIYTHILQEEFSLFSENVHHLDMITLTKFMQAGYPTIPQKRLQKGVSTVMKQFGVGKQMFWDGLLRFYEMSYRETPKKVEAEFKTRITNRNQMIVDLQGEISHLQAELKTLQKEKEKSRHTRQATLDRAPKLSDLQLDVPATNFSDTLLYDLEGADRFLLDHRIDNSVYFPLAGHIYTVWRAYGAQKTVQFNNINVLNRLPLQNLKRLELNIEFATDASSSRYRWIVRHDGTALAQGLIDEVEKMNHVLPPDQEGLLLTRDEYYNLPMRLGQHPGPHFKLVIASRVEGDAVFLERPSHWIPYLNALLHASSGHSIYSDHFRNPTFIETFIILNTTLEDVDLWARTSRETKRALNNSVYIQNIAFESVPYVNNETLFLERYEFFEYAFHLLPEPEIETLALNCMIEISDLFLEYTHANPDCYDAYPHLLNMKAYVEQYEQEYSPKFHESEPSSAQLLMRELLHENMIDEFMEDANSVLRQHDFFPDLFSNDPVFYGFTALEPIRLLAQIITDDVCNISALEIGAGTCGFTNRMYPLIQFQTSSYTISDKGAMATPSIGKDVIQKATWDFNTEKFPTTDVNLILASNCLHHANDIDRTLQILYDNLQPGGLLLIEAMLPNLPVFIFGFSKESWENIEDDRSCRWLSEQEWEDRVNEAGFRVVMCFSSQTMMTLLLKKLENIERVEVITRWQDVNNKCDQIIINRDVFHSYLGFTLSAKKEGYLRLRSYLVGDNDLGSDLVGVELEMRTNVMEEGKHGLDLAVPLRVNAKTDCCHLELSKHADTTSFHWVEDVGGEIKVGYVGMNAQDLQGNHVGLEFSGTLDGEQIMGVGKSCFSKNLPLKNVAFHCKIPDDLSLDEASTIPIAYSMAFYGLVLKAKVESGDKVLIHDCASPLGLAALNVSISRGLTIFGTCHPNEREYVLSKFGIDTQSLGRMKDAKFHSWILKETAGSGVNLVFNASHMNMLKSLDVICKNGCYLHFGPCPPNDIPTRLLEDNTSLHFIKFKEVLKQPTVCQQLVELIQEGLDSEDVKPLPMSLFECNEIDDMFEFMLTEKQKTGKVIVQMTNEAVIAEPRYVTSGTHIITGGLGGFGLELARFLVLCGASRLVLTSRSGIQTAWQKRFVSQLESRVIVVLSRKDCRLLDQTKQLVDGFNDLKGVWHLAAEVRDYPLCEIEADEENWHPVTATKGHGAMNLHIATQEIPLQSFVFFSTIMNKVGSPGQCSYCWGNACGEQVCKQRRKQGLPALAIQWGSISDYLPSHKNLLRDVLLADGVEPFSINTALHQLHYLLCQPETIVTCSKLSRNRYERSQPKPLISDWLLKNGETKKFDFSRETVENPPSSGRKSLLSP